MKKMQLKKVELCNGFGDSIFIQGNFINHLHIGHISTTKCYHDGEFLKYLECQYMCLEFCKDKLKKDQITDIVGSNDIVFVTLHFNNGIKEGYSVPTNQENPNSSVNSFQRNIIDGEFLIIEFNPNLVE